MGTIADRLVEAVHMYCARAPFGHGQQSRPANPIFTQRILKPTRQRGHLSALPAPLLIRPPHKRHREENGYRAAVLKIAGVT